MKKNIPWKLAAGIFAAAGFLFLTGASIWEGAAAVSSGTDLPESGVYVATNSFPQNTVVDITNLENGRTVRGIVTAPLDSPGLLAIISRDGATAIGLQRRSIGRVRITVPADPLTASRLTERASRSGDPDYDPGAALKEYGGGEGLEEPGSAAEIPYGDDGTDAEDAIAEDRMDEPSLSAVPGVKEDEPAITDETARTEEPRVAEHDSDNGIPAEEAWFIPETAPPKIAERANSPANPESEYRLLPAENRPPSPLDDYQWNFIDPIPETASARPPHSPGPAPERFSVPSLAELEPGKYYVQLGAYSKRDTVETEIGKIGRNYPLKVQAAIVMDKQVYRILLGPVNRGESGALLQRFKGNGYTGAFVRKGG